MRFFSSANSSLICFTSLTVSFKLEHEDWCDALLMSFISALRMVVPSSNEVDWHDDALPFTVD